MPRFVAWLLVTGMLILGPGVASGQGYPNKVIRISTAAVGSASDIVARIIAHKNQRRSKISER